MFLTPSRFDGPVVTLSPPLSEAYRSGQFDISFEIFPPKTAEGDGALWANVAPLAAFHPTFISCTYGAGGSTRGRTLELCEQITKRFDVSATAHFTCLGGSVDELREWLTWAGQHGVRNIMALRGDAPVGQADWKQVEGGLRYANELVELIHREFPQFGIGVAGYPEKHPQAPSLEVDITNLKRKVDAGADAIFTQLFYVNDAFYRFRDRCEQAGIKVPIVPGLMPVTNVAQTQRFTQMCGSRIPQELLRRLRIVESDASAVVATGVHWCAEQARQLLDKGVRGIHFYTLNKSSATLAVHAALGL